MIIKLLVVATLLAIVASLGSGLLFLVKDTGGTKRMVRALTIRISLSVVLFLLLLLGYYTGIIRPHGL
jgi:hypothetical protein